MKYKSFKIVICFLLIILLILGIVGYFNKKEVPENNVKENKNEEIEEVKRAKLTFVGHIFYMRIFTMMHLITEKISIDILV